jgi:16S rRNA (uracil1498-N3)-methyltransferase
VRVTRIFVAVTLASGQELTLPADAANHVQRVLRLRAGAELVLFNGRGGEYRATLLRADREATVARVGQHQPGDRESPLQLTLLQGVSRGERMDTIVQKATELGVTRIQPLLTEFSVVKLDADAAAKRRAHWQAVAIGACEQCGRNRVPEIAAVLDYAVALAAVATAPDLRLVLAPDAPQSLVATARGDALMLLVGPEGGLSERELLLAARAEFLSCRLGPRVLRTETAPLAALAVLQALHGDLRQ